MLPTVCVLHAHIRFLPSAGFFLLNCSKVKKAAAIVREATRAFISMPGLFFFPYVTVSLQVDVHRQSS